MIEYFIGQNCRYAGLVVTIRSLRGNDGRYTVEDSTGAFFRVGHEKLSPLGIGVEKTDRSTPFQDIASRAAMSSKGMQRGKSKLR